MIEKIQSTIKSDDTEEFIDKVWTRPIGYAWTLLFARLDVHPNTVTIMSMVLGAMAGICFFFPSWRLGGESSIAWMTPMRGLVVNICGVLLLAWANFYDSADGQLARLTGKTTRLGRILDGAAGDIWYIVIYLAIIFRLWHQDIPFTTHAWGMLAFVFVAIDGLMCHPSQCRVSDYYRNMHLYFLKGKEGSEVDTYPIQKALYETLSWKHDFTSKFFQMFYVAWCKGQAKDTPELQKLLAWLKRRYGSQVPPQEFRQEYRRNSFPLLKWTNFLTFNWRAIFLYVSCIADLPWLVIAIETFLFSAVRIYMIRKHEAFCKRMREEWEKK